MVMMSHPNELQAAIVDDPAYCEYLRDQIALAIAASYRETFVSGTPESNARAAKAAYDFAEAMLIERARRPLYPQEPHDATAQTTVAEATGQAEKPPF